MADLTYLLNKFIVKKLYLKNVEINIKGKLPKKPVIIIANHDNPWDPPLIMIAANKIVHFFTAKLLFKNIISNLFLKSIKQIPVQSGLIAVNEKAFLKASYYLKNNGLVGIFPYPYDMIKKKKVLYTGVIRLIVENHAPIIPIKVKLNEKRKWKSFYDVNFTKANIIIGKPIKNFRNKCKKAHKNSYTSLTKKLLTHIENLK